MSDDNAGTPKKPQPETSTDPQKAAAQKDVSLGPACLVVFVFFLVILCVVVAILSFLLTGKQGGRAAYAVREQLIPWVDQSPLSKSDQVAIIDELMSLASKMERDELTARQLTRLGIRLTDSTILQWGVVEQIHRVAQKSEGLTDEEKRDFTKVCDRWLRAAGEGRLSMTEMEFAFQGTANKEPRSGRLDLKDSISDDQLREFYRRVLAICDRYEISSDPYDKSVSQVFKAMVEDGMKEQ